MPEPDRTYTEPLEGTSLTDGKSLKGWGHPSHGIQGKDADLAGGQVVIREAWHDSEGVDAIVYAYATEPHEDCDACEWGECDGIDLQSGDIHIRVPIATNDEDEAIEALLDAINAHPTIRSICTNLDPI